MCVCVCVCLRVRSRTTQGCGCCYLEALTGLTLRFHGWLGGVFVCVCVCAPQQEARAMFRSVAERDTEGLFPPSLLSVPIYTNKIQQDKQNSNCMQSAATHTHTHTCAHTPSTSMHKDNQAQPNLSWTKKKK